MSDAKFSLSKQDDAVSARLVEARSNAALLAQFPGELPESLEQAYAIQSAAITRWPDAVAGWKVARLPPHDRGRFPAERLSGPVFKSMVRTAPDGSNTATPIFDGGLAAIEAEIVLELGVGLAPELAERTDEELAALVSRAYSGAEIASSPMPFVIDLGAMAIIPDLGINVGVIVGPEIENFRAADSLTTRVTVDGEVVGEANPGAVVGDPLQALRFLIDNCASRGIELPEGTLVSTGMITGVHDVRVGSVAHVDFSSVGSFDVTFEAFSGK